MELDDAFSENKFKLRDEYLRSLSEDLLFFCGYLSYCYRLEIISVDMQLIGLNNYARHVYHGYASLGVQFSGQESKPLPYRPNAYTIATTPHRLRTSVMYSTVVHTCAFSITSVY